MIDKINNVASHGPLRGAGDTNRFVEGDIDRFGQLACCTHNIAINADSIAGGNLIAEARWRAVKRDATFGQQYIGIAPGPTAAVTKVFINPHALATYQTAR